MDLKPRYRRSTARPMTTPHTVYTEAQSLDEACDIIARQKAHRTKRAKKVASFVELELGEKPKVSLAKFSWGKSP